MLLCFLLWMGDPLLNPKADAIKVFEDYPGSGIWHDLIYQVIRLDDLNIATFIRGEDPTAWNLNWATDEGRKFLKLKSAGVVISYVDNGWTIGTTRDSMTLQIGGELFGPAKEIREPLARTIVQKMLSAKTPIHAKVGSFDVIIEMKDFEPAFDFFCWKYKTFIEGVKY